MMNRLCAVGAVLILSANSALAWNYGGVTYYQPIAGAKGNVSFKRTSEMRNGPEGSAVEDLKRWRKESVSLIAGKGSLPGTYGMTLTYVKEQPVPTVRIDISNLNEKAMKHPWLNPATVITYTVTCVQLTLREQGQRKVRIEIASSDAEMKKYERMSGTFVLGREEDTAKNRDNKQEGQANHTAPDHPKIEVYCCAVQTYRPWMKRPAPPRDYNPYHFSAHVEVYLPELGVAYLPASGSFLTADLKRYSEPTSDIVGRGRRTIRATRITGLTLTAQALRDVLQKHKAYLEKKSAPNKSTAGDGKQPPPTAPKVIVVRIGDSWDAAITALATAGAIEDRRLAMVTRSHAEWNDDALGVPKMPVRQVWRLNRSVVKLWGDTPPWARDGKQGRITRIEVGQLREDKENTWPVLEAALQEVKSVSIGTEGIR